MRTCDNVGTHFFLKTNFVRYFKKSYNCELSNEKNKLFT